MDDSLVTDPVWQLVWVEHDDSNFSETTTDRSRDVHLGSYSTACSTFTYLPCIHVTDH